MGLVLAISVFAFLCWTAQGARERAAEYAATGMLRSPLYWSAVALTMTLLGLATYMAHLGHEGPIPWPFWLLVGILTIIILMLRRALKWRYPI
ncbi:hypothetical protein XH83_33855 [Bradyrhizobium sp. CCBAU 53351]|uniref:hypothetical protein n=1 Tax=Bradyrhizobium sp. CCBAU 53351 TaxID=1325114 RepID=UPI001886D8AA|nr:hypothetical protein [Bradyrhizobium sp. CCBAU 53351]QOZ79930.1 hypothetical protein XH83_33855 [Bradyrhizobium sp. CCBAU 53351]